MKLVHQISVQLVDWRTLSFRVAAVIDSYLLIRVVEFPGFTLIFVEEVHHEEWVLKVNEEVAHVGHFLGFLLVFNDVKSGISSLVVTINLVLELFLGIPTWDVFYAKICSQFKPLLDEVNSDRLTIASLVG